MKTFKSSPSALFYLLFSSFLSNTNGAFRIVTRGTNLPLSASALGQQGHTKLYQSTSSFTELNLTPELEKLTKKFASIPQEKKRYAALLFEAKSLPPVDSSVMVPENKVPGCLSTVHVDCEAVVDERGVKVINFVGDSDGLLTKGLLSILVQGLSGHTVKEILAVDPKFVQIARISQTLTPSRNNGFLNMLNVMKEKAMAAAAGDDNATEKDKSEDATNGEDQSQKQSNLITSFDEIDGKPMYNSIMSILTSTLKPSQIELVDNSRQHVGHAGTKGWEESGESHFALFIVSDAFDGLSLVKRHQLIYTHLGDIMSKIHALQIQAKLPSEV